VTCGIILHRLWMMKRKIKIFIILYHLSVIILCHQNSNEVTISLYLWQGSVENQQGFVKDFVVQGESPGCRLISTASMLEWLKNFLPHHSQGSSTERWS